jgi:acetylornithine deacetylase/succinyl-diaminopimelate desuccinylase-like protein
VNPGDGRDDPAVMGEERMAKFLAKCLEEKGFRVVLEEQAPGRPNVIGTYGPEDAAHDLLVEAHLDTVSVRNMTVDPFAGEVRDGRLYGRGACDTKGPMAAALAACEPRVLAGLAAAGCRVTLVGAVDEEKGAEGAAHLARTRRVTAHEAIVLEPTDLDLVRAHKGVYWFEVVTEGVTAHGSNPASGLSAIRGMETFMSWLREHLDLGQDPTAPFEQATLNIGRIEGGSAVNIVPGSCRIEADLRTVPGTDHGEVAGHIRSGLKALQEEGAISGFRLQTIKECPPFATAEDCPLARRLGAACRAEGKEPKVAGTGWFSDAGPLAQVCGDVLVFGPGSIEQAHTPDEFIEIEALVRGARILRRFLESTADELAARAPST